MTNRLAILDGDLREEAEARVRAIARELARPYGEWALSQRADDTGLRTVSLGLGRCGLAVFYAWLWRSGLDEGASEHAIRLLEESIGLLPSQNMDASFFCGFPSVAWTVEHVMRVLQQPMEDDLTPASTRRSSTG